MVYTVTFNPAIDYYVDVNELQLGATNRTIKEAMHIGGKGINVSIVLAELGVPSIALGFVAGFTGTAVENGLRSLGISTDFVHLGEGNSRINIKVRTSKEMTETEINAQGPIIDDRSLEALLVKLDNLVHGDILILSGSVPSSLPRDIYARIMEKLSGRNILITVDATGELLTQCLPYKPFLIKPNLQELEDILSCVSVSNDNCSFNKALVEDDLESTLYRRAHKLQDMGAVNVCVSMGGDGAILLDEYGCIHKCAAHTGILKNSVGAGDSMLAGIIAGLISRQNTGTGSATAFSDGTKPADYEYALKLGTAAGGATAFSDSLACKEDIYLSVR